MLIRGIDRKPHPAGAAAQIREHPHRVFMKMQERLRFIIEHAAYTSAAGPLRHLEQYGFKRNREAIRKAMKLLAQTKNRA
ncbi:hypothetical protein AiwAL_01620 [Acidiphilium sp. AL]|uniref:Transposase n=1 Tax=Acidiphilium iwatense TaxID=768198 RepID=A0ABS9DY28_9PROT|nr:MULTISPECIES: hypothetical protein [Acidiphilium]MCF3946229.1 hypothetical protein [Acidiphilium iwatense]MCU4158801.1 hypothetical protein [Acidiphilium sp. AL]